MPEKRLWTDKPVGLWLIWLIVAAVSYAFLPDRLKLPMLALLMLGGLAYVQTYGGGLQPFLDRLTGQGN